MSLYHFQMLKLLHLSFYRKIWNLYMDFFICWMYEIGVTLPHSKYMCWSTRYMYVSYSSTNNWETFSPSWALMWQMIISDVCVCTHARARVCIYVCVRVCVHKYTHTSGSKCGAFSYWSTMWQKGRGALSGHYSDPCSLPCTIIPHLSASLYMFNLTNLLQYWISWCQSSCRNMKEEFIAWPGLNLIYWNYLAEPRFSSTSQST